MVGTYYGIATTRWASYPGSVLWRPCWGIGNLGGAVLGGIPIGLDRGPSAPGTGDVTNVCFPQFLPARVLRALRNTANGSLSAAITRTCTRSSC